MANFNIKRIERDMEKYIPIILQREATDELLKTVTITGCELSHDMSFCKVFFTAFSDLDHKTLEKEVTHELEHQKEHEQAGIFFQLCGNF